MLDAQKVAMELIEGLREIVARVRTGSPDLADQMRRAATSVALNLAEGTRRQGRDKKRVYRIAAAETQELKAALTVAAAWGDDHCVRSLSSLNSTRRFFAWAAFSLPPFRPSIGAVGAVSP
jgi:four helix bundle protein